MKMLRFTVICACLALCYGFPGAIQDLQPIADVEQLPVAGKPFTKAQEQNALPEISQLIGSVTDIVGRIPKLSQGSAGAPAAPISQIVDGREVTLTEQKDDSTGSAKYTMVIASPEEPRKARTSVEMPIPESVGEKSAKLMDASPAKQVAAPEAAPAAEAPKAAAPAPAPASAPAAPAAPRPLTAAELTKMKADLDRDYQMKVRELEFQLERAGDQQEYEEERQELEVQRRLEQVLTQLETELGKKATMARLMADKFSATDLALDGNTDRVNNRPRPFRPSKHSQPRPYYAHLHSLESREHDSREHLHIHVNENERGNVKLGRPAYFDLDSREDDHHDHLHDHTGYSTISRQSNKQTVKPIREEYSPISSRRPSLGYEVDSAERLLSNSPRVVAVQQGIKHPDNSASDEHYIRQHLARQEAIKRSKAAQVKQVKTVVKEEKSEPINENLKAAPAPVKEEMSAAIKTEEPAPAVEKAWFPYFSAVLPKNPNHEMFSDEDDDNDEEDYGFQFEGPQFFFYRPHTQQQDRPKVETSFDSDWAENKIDSAMIDNGGFRDLSGDTRVNRVFRTRNADFFNPDAEQFDVEDFEVNRRRSPIK